MACVLCDDVASTGDVVFEDVHTLVILHDDWSTKGHAMVVAKKHVENVSDLDRDEWMHFARVWHRAESVLREITNAERVIAMKLGIQTPHLHVHLYPFPSKATREDVFAAIDGKTAEPRTDAFVERVRDKLRLLSNL